MGLPLTEKVCTMRARFALSLMLAVAAAAPGLAGPAVAAPRAESYRVVLLDDGERVPRAPSVELPPTPFVGGVELFAMRGEVVAFQAVVQAFGANGEQTFTGSLGPFTSGAGALPAAVEVFAEQFVEIKRTTGGARGTGVGFARGSEPDPALLGFWADALVPGAEVKADSGKRGALWFDVRVPEDASPGLYESTLRVTSPSGSTERAVRLRVLPDVMPYASRPVIAYYDPANLTLRMGDRKAEGHLRQVLHAHHVSAYRNVMTVADLEADMPYLSGAAYSEAAGYRGPGAGKGEGVEVLAAYGEFGEPGPARLPEIEALARRAAELGVLEQTYFDAGEEGPWPDGWRPLFAANPVTKPLKIFAACHSDPRTLSADAIVFLPEVFDPVTAAEATAKLGKRVWGQNGKRPYAGPTVIDAPAVDLRANSWISARYDVAAWTYWEATSWTKKGGGKTPDTDTDPFTVAESFRNAGGNFSNGDGILVYPGRQLAGMTDFGKDEVFPSVRLKNIRRGAQDVGYIDRARAKDRAKADAIVERIVPSALRGSRGPAGWPTRGKDFLDARRELGAMFADVSVPIPAAPGAPTPPAEAAPAEAGGCAASPAAPLGAGVLAPLGALGAGLAVAARRRRQRKV